MLKYFSLIVILIFISCGRVTQGPQGLPGPGGNNGATGATGPEGPQGPAGANGTVITPIQFCTGTPSYPSTFPEYGLLINGRIYAVYSANDGFLTYLPPGEYYSNAIGSSCDFTVNANGTITQD